MTFANDGLTIISRGLGKAAIWDVEHGDKLQTLDHGSEFTVLIDVFAYSEAMLPYTGTGNITAVTVTSKPPFLSLRAHSHYNHRLILLCLLIDFSLLLG